MATYREIQDWIKQKYNIPVNTCWIADIKRRYNLTTRIAPNRKDQKLVKYPCPQKHVEKIEIALIHFDMLTNKLDKLKIKQKIWLRCLLDNDDANSIFHQIDKMVWDMGVFKVINKCLELAPPRENGGVQVNSAIWFLIDRCFFESQMLAIRRLTDNYGVWKKEDEYRLTGSEGVYSLKNLIKDMKDNIDLLTRENLFKINGLEYHVELIERKKNEYMRKRDKNDYTVPQSLNPDHSEHFHERIDKFSVVKPESRNPNDTVQVKILDDLMKNLEKSVEKEECYVNKHIAHAATKESRDSSKINLETDHPTLQSILDAQETIAKTANFIINIFRFSGLVFSGLPFTSFDILEYIEKPFASVDVKPKLEEVFSEFRMETQEWYKWEDIF